jgi:hypothetical protein
MRSQKSFRTRSNALPWCQWWWLLLWNCIGLIVPIHAQMQMFLASEFVVEIESVSEGQVGESTG